MVGALVKAIPAIMKVHNTLGMVDGVIKVIGGDVEKLAKMFGQRWYEMNDIAFKTARTMAMSREQAVRYNDQLIKSTRELAAQYGVTAKELADFQKTYQEAVGRNVILTREQLSHMSALSKITDQATASKLVDEFDKVGVGIARATAYTGRLQERAKALGVSPAKATKMMADNIKLAASYSFRNGVNDIEKMALKATSMRMDMNAIMSATEKFADIESAIGTSANIQMLGGSFAREFSNPMGAMYEAMADPQAFQERILRTVQGKGTYNAKTGAVEFDPVTMRMMRELAKNLGMTVDQITNPAMAGVQNEKVKAEFEKNANKNGFSPKDIEAIKNLSRTNVDEETGKHFITYLEDGEEKTAFVEDLTQQQLELAKDSKMTEEGLWGDVQDIKTILERVHGRARETKSMKEGVEGTKSWWDSMLVTAQNWFMPAISNKFNRFTNTLGRSYYSEGGIVEPIHAEFGAMVPGSSYTGDRVHAMVNSGEMILNQGEQKGLFDLLKNIATTGAMIYGGNKLGGHFGVSGLGLNAALGSLVNGGGLTAGSMLGTGAAMFAGNKMMMHGMMPMGMGINRMGGSLTLMNPTVVMNGNTIMNGSIGDGSLVEELEDIADAAGDATRNTRSFSMRLRDLSKKDTFLGRRARGYRKFKVGTGRFFNKIKVGTGNKLSAGKAKILDTKLFKTLGSYKDTVRYNFKYGKFGDFYENKYKPGVSSFKQNIRDLFNDGSKAQASKIASRHGKLGTPEIAMTGRNTGVVSEVAKETTSVAKTANAATNATKAIGTGGKLLKGIGTAGKFLGKAAGPLAGVMAAVEGIGAISSASSQYDAKVDEIEKSGMSELDKAKAKDKAAKEKNGNIGSGVGSAIGGTIGGIAGMALGPLGAMAGGWLGSKVGGFLGKGIGGLFGGNNEKKFKEEQEKLFGKDKESIKSNDDIISVLKSIDGKLSMISGKNIGLKTKTLESPMISPIDVMKKAVKGVSVLGKNLPPIAAARVLGKASIGKSIKEKIDSGVKGLPITGNFLKVAPSKDSDIGLSKQTSIGKTDINLNVSGTIKLEGGGKSVDFDLAKLIDTPEFKRQLADIVTRRINENSNSGKRNMESERNNMASQYNKSGS